MEERSLDAQADVGGCTTYAQHGISLNDPIKSNYGWSPLKPINPPPEPRAAHSADVIGGSKIYIFAGWNGRKALNDLHVLETDKLKWTEVSTANVPFERNNVGWNHIQKHYCISFCLLSMPLL